VQHVKDELNVFRKIVIAKAKQNLSKKSNTGNLSKSITSNLEVYQSGNFLLEFDLGEYGEFVDKGVKGAAPSQVSKNAKIKGQQAPNSPYKFRNKRPPSKPLEDWAKKKNVRLRSKDGKFAKGSYKTIGMILAKNIWARGLKPSLFFTKPFESEFKQLSNELVEAFGLDIDEFLQYTLNKYE
jgi:hypothetical protein